MGFSIRSAIILAGGVVLAFGASNTNLPGQSHPPGASPAFQASVATHETGVELQTAPGFQSTTEMAAQGEIEIPAPTRSTFMASWPSVKRCARLPVGCFHERFVQQLRRWLPRPGCRKRERSSCDWVEPGNDLLLSGARLWWHRFRRALRGNECYDGDYCRADH